jgi:hypothetical protein
MVIVTSLFNEWQCDLHVPLECFTEKVADQYLTENLGDINDDCLSCIQDSYLNLPLALNNLVAYYKQKQQLLKLENKDYSINDLVQETAYLICPVISYKSPAQFYNFKPFSFLNDCVELNSMCEEVMGTLRNRFDLALKLLKFLSYLGDVDVAIVFKNLEGACDQQEINEAIITLSKFSLLKINSPCVLLEPMLQRSVKYILCKKDNDVLKEMLAHFQKQTKEDHDKLPQIYTESKVQIYHYIFKENYINDSLLQEFDLLLLLGATNGLNGEITKKLKNVYRKITKRLNHTNSIKFHCFYVRGLCKCKAYKDALETCDSIISKNSIRNLKQDFYGLKLLHYKCVALYQLNEELQVAWDICYDLYTLLLNRNIVDCKALAYSLVLLCNIACAFKEEGCVLITLEVCKNAVQRVCFTIFDWKDSEFFVQEMKAVGVLIDQYLKTKNVNIALEYITDLKKKIEIRHAIRAKEDYDYNINHTIAVNKYLDYKICECLLELNDTKKAWDKLHDLIQTPNFSPQFISDIVLTLSKIASKLNVENKTEELKKCYDGIKKLLPEFSECIKFKTSLEATQILANVLIYNGMKTEALYVYVIFEQSLQKCYVDMPYNTRIFCRAKISKLIHMYEHDYTIIDIWEQLIEILNSIHLLRKFCFDDEILPDLNSITRPILYELLIKVEQKLENNVFKELKLNI